MNLKFIQLIVENASQRAKPTAIRWGQQKVRKDVATVKQTP